MLPVREEINLVLLVRPPSLFGDYLNGFQLDIPVGLLYLAAALEKQGYRVEVFDARIDMPEAGLYNTFENRSILPLIWRPRPDRPHAGKRAG